MYTDIVRHLPDYEAIKTSCELLDLPFSASGFHGLMCGYISKGEADKGQQFFISMFAKGQTNEENKQAAIVLFELYQQSYHLLAEFDFSFTLAIPDDHCSIQNRAQAFAEWCQGYIEGFYSTTHSVNSLNEHEQEILTHLQEFSKLDTLALQYNECDEKALFEVVEYTRMAVLELNSSLPKPKQSSVLEH